MVYLLLITLLSFGSIQAQDQTFQCSAMVSDLINTGPAGSTANWFPDLSSVTPLALTTPLNTGTYYVEQTIPFNIATLGSGFSGPTGLAIEVDGKIIVADFQNNLIKRMNADGSGIVTLGSGFFQPIDVAVEADGKILVVEFGTGLIKRMNTDGSGIITIASGFNFPSSVTVQNDGKILVSNQGANTVVRINADGTGQVTLGSGFNRPYETAVQSDGKIVVADAGNNIIKRMNADGTGIVTLASGFNSPRRIAIQDDQKILIGDFGNSAIKRINTDGLGLVTLGSGFGNIFGVTFEATGKILVCDFGNNAIKRITEAYTTSRAAVNVIVNTTPLPTRDMSINGTLCNGATIGTLISKFNNSANVICYAGPSGGLPLSASQLIAPVNSNVTFYLTQTIAGCESARFTYNAYVNFVTPPNAAPIQNFCSGATVANLVATPGTSGGSPACCLNWFANPSGGIAIPSSTPLTSGVYYVGQLHISGCTIERTMVTVTVNSGILSAPTANSTQVYAGTATILNLTATGTNLNWYAGITGGAALPNTTTLVDGTIYYVSQSNLCSESTRTAVTVRRISEASQSFCSVATVNDLVSTPASGSVVKWYDSFTSTNELTSATPLNSGTYYIEESIPTSYTTIINSGLLNPRGVVVQQNGKIVFADSNSSSIKRMNADGSNMETLNNNAGFPSGITIQQDGKIVFTDFNISTINRMNSDGSGLEILGSGFNYPSDVAIQQDGKIIIADRNNHQIKRMNADGSNIEVLGSGFSFPSGLAIQQDGKIIIADGGNSQIKRMNTDGTNIEILGTGLSYPNDVDIQSNGKIIFTNDNYSVKRMNSLGLEIETLITGIFYPYIAIEQNGNIIVSENDSSSIKRIIEGFTTARVPITVSITPNTDNVTTISACGSYTWDDNGITYNTTGIYTGTTTNCVTEKLDVTITPLADNSVTQSGDYLTATETGATYQWLTCETNGSFTPINLATNQSYFATNIGSYAVEVTKNGCTTKSACVDLATLNNTNFDKNTFSYYPNPTSDVLHISNNKEISEIIIYNLLGQNVLSKKYNTLEVAIDLSQLPTNTYLVKVICGENSNTFKIMKK